MPSRTEPEALYRLVGERIASARRNRNPRVTQQKLAKAIGLTRTSIANIEAGRQFTSLHVVWRIAEFLERDPRDLLPVRSDLESVTESADVSRSVRKILSRMDDSDARQLESFIGSAQSRLNSEVTHASSKNAKSRKASRAATPQTRT